MVVKCLNEYLKLVEDAQQKRIDLTKYQIAAIKDMYNDVWRSLRLRTHDSTFGSLNDRWLKDYRSQFRVAVRELNTILESQITGAMEQSATYAAEIQSKMFDILDVDPTFSKMFTKVPKETIAELVGGGFYKDGKGLSKRIWHNENKANADFDYIIQKGIAEKRSIADIAADLSKYVNPNANRDMDFKKIYPKIGNRNIEYNSFRLAVTSISHAYQLSMQRSCGKNPFVEGIQWNISNSHRGTCSECRGRDGVIFKPHELPLDHPNGICYFTPVVEKSMEDIGTELRKWVNGSPNDTLDRWYIQNGGNELLKALENKLSDKKQYEKYKEILGKEVPKTFDKFQELKYNNSNEWELFKNYAQSRSKNMISVFSSFDDYKKYKTIIDKEIVGLKTVNGIEIKSQSKHFIERVLGTSCDPEKKRPRDGIEADDILKTLENPLKIKEEPKKNSHKFIGEKITITINPNTGNLIQCNPTDSDLVRRLKNV